MEVLGLVSVPDWLLFLVTVLFVVYLYSTWPYSHLKHLGLDGPKPYPFMGSFNEFFNGVFGACDVRNMKKYGKIYTMYEGRVPTVVFGDHEALREIMLKKGQILTDRRVIPLRGPLKLALTDLPGEEWKRVRNLMTPAFSTGKLKAKVKMIQNSVSTLMKNLDKSISNGESFQVEDKAQIFTMDVIAATAFGVSTDAANDPDNPYVTQMKKLNNISFANPLLFLSILFPFVGTIADKVFQKSMLDDEMVEFFTNVVNEASKRRKDSGEDYADLLQALVNAHNEELDEETRDVLTRDGLDHVKNKKGLSEGEIMANALTIFMAGFATTANSISFFLFTLAHHPEIQEKLYSEIVSVCGTDEPIAYEHMNQLTYLNMCLNESLRLYPSGLRVDRWATEDIEIKGLKIPANTALVIPIFALHRDPEVWPEPEKYDPERFTPEAVKSRSHFAWLPFGEGPRNCIGMRLALLEIKMCIAYLVRAYNFKSCDKSVHPPRLEGFLKATDGLWLSAEHR